MGCGASGDLKFSEMADFSVRIDLVKPGAPMPVAGKDFPPCMQGNFWLTEQKGDLCMFTFARSMDGLTGGKLEKIEDTDDDGKVLNADCGYTMLGVYGDRTAMFADEGTLHFMSKKCGICWHFYFNNSTKPTSCRVETEFIRAVRARRTPGSEEHMVKFEMNLLQDGHADYPGCVVWRCVGKTTFLCVQVVNGKKKRTSAFAKMVEFINSPESGDSPGELHYRSTQALAWGDDGSSVNKDLAAAKEGGDE